MLNQKSIVAAGKPAARLQGFCTKQKTKKLQEAESTSTSRSNKQQQTEAQHKQEQRQKQQSLPCRYPTTEYACGIW